MDTGDAPLEGQQSGKTPFWRRRTVIATTVGIVVGAAAGAGIAAATIDPTRSEQYAALADQLDRARMERGNAQDATRTVEERLADAQDTIRAHEAAESELEEREQAVETRETDVATREAAVSAAEQRVAETTITEGTWTVGRDIEPGTYSTASAVTSGRCYWAIYTSGTNGSDIVENDIVTGGMPTVTLSEGQDFNTSRCGEWRKQG